MADLVTPLPPLPDGSRMLGGAVRFMDAEAMSDMDYVNGIGLGGVNGNDGGHGMVVLHLFTGWQLTSVAKTVFHYR